MTLKPQIYAGAVNPETHPLYRQRNAPAVTRRQLGNQIRFILGLRWFETDEKGNLLNLAKAFDRCTKEFDLGDVMWPMYPTLFAGNFKAFAEEAAKRSIYLMDFGGYVPGSNPEPGSIWGEFQPPPELVRYLHEMFGDHFLGWANGEQDGRYIGGYAGLMCPAPVDRTMLYHNFHAFFEKFENHMGNHMVLLSSLNFPHYFARQGNTTILGAETAQALPCVNMWYSYLRGAGKQYGLLWFGNASIWNRWGWKDYDRQDAGGDYNEDTTINLVSNNLEHGPDCGTSLSLLKRILYTEYMYNSDFLGFEASWFLESENRLIDDKFVRRGSDAILSPIGILQEGIKKFVDHYQSPGVMYTPVCILLDFFNGFVPPRHLYTKGIYKVWGNNPYRLGDYQLHQLFNLLYPDYEDAGFFRDETGFLTATPYGDIADVMLSDLPGQVLDMYTVVLAFGEGTLNLETYDKFIRFVKNGGHGIICCDKIVGGSAAEYMPEALQDLGLKQILAKASFEGNVSHDGETGFERNFELYPVIAATDAQVMAKTEDGRPVILKTRRGKGMVSVICAAAGIRLRDSTAHRYSKDNKDNKKIAQPYEFITCVERYLGQVFRELNFLGPNNPVLQYSVNTVSANEFNVLVCNNRYAPETFDLTGDGPLEITERVIDDVSEETPGFTPQAKYFPRAAKSAMTDGRYSIQPLGVKIFNVKTSTNRVDLKPVVSIPARQENLYVRLPEVTLKEFCLNTPAAANYITGLKVDAPYLEKIDHEYAVTEADYIKRQKVEIIVDFSGLINHYPDLSLIRNIKGRTEESVSRIERVLNKAALYGCRKAILSLHRNAENKVTPETAQENLNQTFGEITALAKALRITVYLQNGKSLDQHDVFAATNKIYPFLSANTNLKYAYNLCHSLGAGENPEAVFMEKTPNGILLSAPDRDLFGQFADTHYPISRSAYLEQAKVLAVNNPKCDFICLDAVYKNFDEIYHDIMMLYGDTKRE